MEVGVGDLYSWDSGTRTSKVVSLYGGPYTGEYVSDWGLRDGPFEEVFSSKTSERVRNPRQSSRTERMRPLCLRGRGLREVLRGVGDTRTSTCPGSFHAPPASPERRKTGVPQCEVPSPQYHGKYR